MHLLGKVLLVVNALAAAGLVYVAAQDWSRRQEITAAALKHHLVLKGLPVDAPAGANPDSVPLNLETSGGYVVESVRPSLLASYFQGADGGGEFGGAGAAVKSQLEELKRVQEKADAVVRAGDDAAKLAKLAGRVDNNAALAPGWLMNMAETYEQRELIRKLATTVGGGDPQAIKEAADTAQAMFQKRFAAALANPDPKLAAAQADRVKAAVDALRAAPADDAARKALTDALSDEMPAATSDDGDRRRQIAHILMSLDSSAAWQKRVGLVVGLRALQHAVADQATRMQDMARSAQRQLELDQLAFTDQYTQLQNFALERAQLLEQQSQLRKSLESRAATEKDAVNQRKRQLDDRVAELDRRRQEVAKQLAEQANAEQALFAAQKEAGQTLQRTFDLESQLEAAERAKTTSR